MKKIVAQSLIFTIGALIFLYSEQAFADTAIYDPLDPQNTITPVPNEENGTSDTTVMESFESRTSEKQKAAAVLDNHQNKAELQLADQGANFSESLQPNAALKKADDLRELKPSDPYLPKWKARPKNQVLMLDDEFFSSTNTAIPPDSGGGPAGTPNDFSDIAQSAYLLSGVVLYGEAKGKLDLGMSDRFAG